MSKFETKPKYGNQNPKQYGLGFRRKKTKRQPERINKTINSIIKDLRSVKKTTERRILELWPKISGKRISRHTKPTVLKKGCLVVNVDNPAWLYELVQRHRERLLKKIQAKVGEKKLVKIRFRIGEL